MSGSFEKLTVALAVELNAGTFSVGTGVPVAPGIVLTARHVVVPDDAVQKPVRVRFWHATEPGYRPDQNLNPTGFIDAFGQENAGLDAARGVIWSSEILDAALVSVSHPVSVPIARLARTEPGNAATWASEAFPHAMWELGAPEPVRLTGTSHSRVPHKPRYQVDAAIAMTVDAGRRENAHEGWSGASGAGLFVNGLLMGLLLARRPNGEAKILEAVPIVDCLADQEFRRLVGRTPEAETSYDLDLMRSMSTIPPHSKPHVAVRLGLAPDADDAQLAAALSNLPLSEGTRLLIGLKKGAAALDTPTLENIALGYAACRCAPVDLSTARDAAFGAEINFDDCAAGTRAGAEFLMAAVENRLPSFQPSKAGQAALPAGTHALPQLPESGCQGTGSQIAEDVEARLGADLLDVDRWLEDSLGLVCEFPVDSVDRFLERRGMLQDELAFRAEGEEPAPSYYLAEVDDGPDRAAERKAIQDRLQRIRQDYPEIGVVYIKPDRARQERRRLRPLLPLLPKEVDYD